MSRFMIAAPSSGAGKTTVTLALMRLLQRAKIEFQPAKSGPDYIDPGFHSIAAGTPSVNLDAWAMPQI
jgi:cobyrinic acid a,c-diamide synthase